MKNKQKGDARWSVPFFFYTPMQEVTPKVVAIAVRTVMMMLRILPQIDLFSMVVFKFRISTINCHSERSEDELLRASPKNLKSASGCIQILPPFGRLNDRVGD